MTLEQQIAESMAEDWVNRTGVPLPEVGQTVKFTSRGKTIDGVIDHMWAHLGMGACDQLSYSISVKTSDKFSHVIWADQFVEVVK